MRTDIKKRIITSCYTYNNPFCIQIFYKLPTKLGEAGRFIPTLWNDKRLQPTGGKMKGCNGKHRWNLP